MHRVGLHIRPQSNKDRLADIAVACVVLRAWPAPDATQWVCAPRHSRACSTTITVACGTSTPTSTTVVLQGRERGEEGAGA